MEQTVRKSATPSVVDKQTLAMAILGPVCRVAMTVSEETGVILVSETNIVQVSMINQCL